MEKLAYNKLFKGTAEALYEIQKGEEILNDLTEKYCAASDTEDMSTILGMLHDYIERGIYPKGRRAQAVNWAFDYRSICIKLDVVFDYMISCRKILEKLGIEDSAAGEPGVEPEEESGAA